MKFAVFFHVGPEWKLHGRYGNLIDAMQEVAYLTNDLGLTAKVFQRP